MNKTVIYMQTGYMHFFELAAEKGVFVTIGGQILIKLQLLKDGFAKDDVKGCEVVIGLLFAF